MPCRVSDRGIGKAELACLGDGGMEGWCCIFVCVFEEHPWKENEALVQRFTDGPNPLHLIPSLA